MSKNQKPGIVRGQQSLSDYDKWTDPGTPPDVFRNNGAFEKEHEERPLTHLNYKGECKREFWIAYHAFSESGQVVEKRRSIWQFTEELAINLLKRVDTSFVCVERVRDMGAIRTVKEKARL